MKSDSLKEMKTEAPQPTMSGALLEEKLGKHDEVEGVCSLRDQLAAADSA